jgi:hypothetical protein
MLMLNRGIREAILNLYTAYKLIWLQNKFGNFFLLLPQITGN